MSGCYAVFHKQLGDLVLLEPALRRLAAASGGVVRLLTRGGHAPLMRLMHGVEFQAGSAWRPLRMLVSFDGLNKSVLRALVAPAAEKICVLANPAEAWWMHRLVFRSVRKPGLGDSYVAEYYWRMAGGEPDGEFSPPRLDRPPPDWALDGLTPGEFILVNPTSGWRQKTWQADRWIAALREIHALSGIPFVITSASLDWQVAHAQEVAAGCGAFGRGLAGTTAMETFLWLCANARLVLTVDGSPAHLARAFGVPSVALFGPSHLPNWHLPSETTLAVQAPLSAKGKRRTKDIPTEAVIEAAKRLLA